MKVYSDVSKAPKRRIFKNILVNLLDEDLTNGDIDDIRRRKQDHGSTVIFYTREPSNFNRTTDYLTELKPTYLMFDVFDIEISSDIIEYYNDYKIITNVSNMTDYHGLTNLYDVLQKNADIVGIPLNEQINRIIGYGENKTEIMSNGRYEVIQKMIRDGIWDWRKPHCLIGCMEKDHELYKDINIEFSVDM